ncbi:MAG: ABC transporter permease [Planctomycetota bacterium]
MTAAIELRDLRFAHLHADGEEVLFEGATLSLPAHGFYLFVGTSGGGKSSLLRVFAGLVEPREPAPMLRGEIRVLGESVFGEYPRALRTEVAAILQDEGLLDDLSPRQNVELALRAAGRSRRLAPALLAQAGIDDPPARTAMLSGGMRKRVAVARALALCPRLLLCDEPTAGLDPESARTVALALRAANDEAAARTTIVVTHDLQAFTGLCDGVLVLDRQRRTLRLCGPDFRPEPTLDRDPPPRRQADTASLHGVRSLLLRLAAAAETALQAVRRLPPVELGRALRTFAALLLEPLPFVAIGGAVIGGLAMFFALRNNPVEGAFETALITGTGKVVAAVLVPLMCGLFFTARVAAGATARIGTMKRTNQISGLAMMGIDPADYLLTPLVWGMTLALPVATVAGIVAGSLAGAGAAALATGVGAHAFAAAWFDSLRAADLLQALAKACLSGFLVAVCCYHLGSGPKRSGGEVGEAVNTAVVWGMALVLAVHAVVTILVYA